MGAGAECLAEVTREGADVRAFRARDTDLHLRQAQRRSVGYVNPGRSRFLDSAFGSARNDNLGARGSRITISDLELLGFVDASDAMEASAETPRTKIFSPEKRSKKFCPTPDADAACSETVILSEAKESVSSTASSRINVADTSSLGLPEAKIRIACSKGTYIRAFARDLGEALGTGAHLSGLVRTKTGAFRLEDALSLEEALALLAD